MFSSNSRLFELCINGEIACEYTNATTTALVSPTTNDWDMELIKKLGISEALFCPIRTAGERLGGFTDEIIKKTGLDMDVILPATHDTGSAFLAAPMTGEDCAILSSGTWSLLGAELNSAVITEHSIRYNFTNEGGYKYRYRFLKNIMGLWMIQAVRKELAEKYDRDVIFSELIEMAAQSSYRNIIDTSNRGFLAPTSMLLAVKKACEDEGCSLPKEDQDIVKCIYLSLANDYKKALEELCECTGRKIKTLCVIGGGSQDNYLNRLIAQVCNIKVLAGPTEATALGNLSVQMIADGVFKNIDEARDMIEKSFEIKRFV